jgi:hypothetical protein
MIGAKVLQGLLLSLSWPRLFKEFDGGWAGGGRYQRTQMQDDHATKGPRPWRKGEDEEPLVATLPTLAVVDSADP